MREGREDNMVEELEVVEDQAAEMAGRGVGVAGRSTAARSVVSVKDDITKMGE
jgi:hypothetical protein